MGSKDQSFKNPFKEYCPDGDASDSILCTTKHGVEISDAFHEKLRNFKSTTLNNLVSNMQKDIYCDGTVYTGSAGLALFYLMSAIETNENVHKNLTLSLKYVSIDNLKGRRISFLCGDAGPLAIATVASYKLGSNKPENYPNYKSIAERLMALISLLNDSPDEVLYGKAGYLYALLFVNKYVGEKHVIPDNHIEKVVAAILQSGKQFAITTKSTSPLLWQWHDKVYLGAAHGVAGILYMLLQARKYVDSMEMQNYIKPTLDWLMTLKFPSGNFPSSLGNNNDRLVQWCHGAPGFVPLCILASQVFEEEGYMSIARLCCDVIWERGLCKKGFSLCHGVSGNAYAFIQLYQATKSPSALYRALCFVEWVRAGDASSQRHAPDRPASLFEGAVGRLYLADDVARLTRARFPALCL